MNKITIVTVCFNAEEEIRDTIESIISQIEKPYEYIIVDGLSKDNTVELAKEYRAKFSEAGVIYKIVSEKDSGIYNAMNKGTRLATGEWIIFLNAGDYFCDEFVIDSVNNLLSEEAEIIYGDVIAQLDTPAMLQKYVGAKPLSELNRGMVFCHQCAFIRKKVLIEFPYDETFKISGDYNFFYGCYKKGLKFKSLDVAISVFLLGGASAMPSVYLEEYERIWYIWGDITEDEYEKRIKSARVKRKVNSIRSIIKQIIPKGILVNYRERKYRREGYIEREKLRMMTH